MSVRIEKGLKKSSLKLEQFEQLAQLCLKVEGIDCPCLVQLSFLDDEAIRKINKKWRDRDQSTDVLSFPASPIKQGMTPTEKTAILKQNWDCETGAAFLGDILINPAQAKRQALDYGHSEAHETSYLFIHAMFHLLAYDHETEADKALMRAREKQVLSLLLSMRVSDEQLLSLAREAMQNAYAPYSRYKVGACLLTEDGRVFQGANLENASFGLTICAERAAVCAAISKGARRFHAIAIAASGDAPWPCGACRQVLSEFSPDLRVLITWGEGQTEESTLSSLLPHQFSLNTNE